VPRAEIEVAQPDPRPTLVSGTPRTVHGPLAGPLTRAWQMRSGTRPAGWKTIAAPSASTHGVTSEIRVSEAGAGLTISTLPIVRNPVELRHSPPVSKWAETNAHIPRWLHCSRVPLARIILLDVLSV
jgi:hypothetical protein